MKKTFFIFYTLMLLVSCTSSSNEESIFQFTGAWKGSFSGTDTGTWKVNIANDGIASGVAHSTVYNQDFDINGTVNSSGQLNAVLGTASGGGVFKGTLSGKSGNGTWSNNIGKPHSGSWSGNKQ